MNGTRTSGPTNGRAWSKPGGRWMVVDDEGLVTRHRSKREARALARYLVRFTPGMSAHVRRFRRKLVMWEPIWGVWCTR